MISPALFVPLVENAFKFASFRLNKPCIDIMLKSDGGVVMFEISNYYEKLASIPDSNHSGYGLINLKKRLELTYPGKFYLKIDPGDSLYNVKLRIDTNAD
jgi:sensor histidine kinase YesM